MKKTIFALVMMLTTAMSASAMSYEQARNEALFLTDKMAYELNLTDAQYEAAYEINLDYLMGVTSVDNVFGTYWERRNLDLSYILYSWQWEAFRAASYFFRPLYWDAGHWHFGVYARYPRRDYFYFGRPHFYATYHGGHAWHRNNGRSFYYGRDNHFRPTLPANRTHSGMRNSFDRGDYRGQAGSSTRITSRQHGNYGNNRSNSSNFSRSSNTHNSNVSRPKNNDNFSRSSSNNNFSRSSNRNGSMNNRPSNTTGIRSAISHSSASRSSAGHSSSNRSSAGRSSGGSSRSHGGSSHGGGRR